MDSRILNLIYLKISRKDQHLHYLEVFLSKPPGQLWNCSPNQSIHNTVWLGWDYIKIYSQNAVKVLDLVEKWKVILDNKTQVNFNFSSVVCCKHDIYMATTSRISLFWYFLQYLLQYQFNWMSVFVKYFGSTSRFQYFVQS